MPGDLVVIVHFDQEAAFGAGFANVPALDIAGEGDHRMPLVKNLPLMNVPERPIVVALGDQTA